MEPDTLVQLVGELGRERSLLSKLSATPTLDNRKFMEVDDNVTKFPRMTPVINNDVVVRMAGKWIDQSNQTIKQAL